MSIFQDHFSMLSEMERLAAMAQDPARRPHDGAGRVAHGHDGLQPARQQ